MAFRNGVDLRRWEMTEVRVEDKWVERKRDRRVKSFSQK